MGTVQGDSNQQLFDRPLTDGVSSFVAAAHELKSPLALIRQLSLMIESGDLSPSDQQRLLRQISLTSERALRLTSDLTRSVRLSEAMFELEPINPQQLCRDIVHELTPLFALHDRRVKLVTRKHPLLLVANRDLLRRVIMSFSDNALHYTQDGSAIEIKVGCHSGGSVIRLGVRDYGPGLSRLNRRQLKSGRNLGPMPLHSRPQSSGLGLYIASQFADAMNAKIGVTQHRDGATFFIDLQASRQLRLI